MKKIKEFFGLVVLVLIASLIPHAYASDASSGSDISLETITAECKADSSDAINPDIYVGNCIEEKLQAQKEEQESVEQANLNK